MRLVESPKRAKFAEKEQVQETNKTIYIFPKLSSYIQVAVWPLIDFDKSTGWYSVNYLWTKDFLLKT